MVENKTVSDGTNETTSQSRQLAVRFAAELVARIEADAAAQNASPTEIVRSIVFEHYSGAGGLDARDSRPDRGSLPPHRL